MDLPLLTPQIPGIGGVIRQEPEDFRVEEIPAYPASGQGDHIFVTLEKTQLTTFEAVRQIASALEVDPRNIGTAGMKDKHAVTQQRISLPPPVTLEAVDALTLPGIRIIERTRHNHKLRTGHLRGNRFCLRLRSLNRPSHEAQALAEQVLAALQQAPGSPNWFGPQRFGYGGKNPQLGREIVAGQRRERGKKKKLLISAFQSLMFNRYLQRRIETGSYRQALVGDVLELASGGLFHCEDAETDSARLLAGELRPTGPMFGHKVKRPHEGTPSRALEDEILNEYEITTDDFKPMGKLAFGTRRSLAIPLANASAAALGEDLELRFDLPSGAFATVVLREITKDDA